MSARLYSGACFHLYLVFLAPLMTITLLHCQLHEDALGLLVYTLARSHMLRMQVMAIKSVDDYEYHVCVDDDYA